MIAPVRRGVLGLVGVSLLAATGARGADAARFHRCHPETIVQCATVRVPLDRSGHVKGTIRLRARRVRARGRRRPPLVVLAGGPGQSAIGAFDFDLFGTFDPETTRRDVIVFDQRGTGRSGLLRCRRFQRDMTGRSAAGCARAIGPRRRFYRSLDSVADIEAVRRAARAPKIALFGASYGTRVAQEYALRHPSRIAVLVLDAVVPLSGSDAFERDTVAALPRAFDAICRPRCPGVPGHPSRALAALVRRAPLRAPLVARTGHRRIIRLTAARIFDLVVGTDVDPIAHVQLPAAVRSAQRGDLAPIARMWRREDEQRFPASFLSVATFAATRCEEGDWPWDRTASPGERLAQARAALAQVPASVFAPLPRSVVIARASDVDICARWPQTPARPPLPSGPYPRVRTLVMAGAQDMRTPLETARKVAARFPRGRFMVFRKAGHTVLSTDETGCGVRAFRRFLAGRRQGHCRPERPFDRPQPPAPRSLRAFEPAGAHGRRGRTVRAVAATLDDVQGEAFSGSPHRTAGGLRGGRVRIGGPVAHMHRVVYVPGVAVSGRFDFIASTARLRIRGSRAAHGHLRVRGRHVTGRLGGRRIDARVRRELAFDGLPFGPLQPVARVR